MREWARRRPRLASLAAAMRPRRCERHGVDILRAGDSCGGCVRELEQRLQSYAKAGPVGFALSTALVTLLGAGRPGVGSLELDVEGQTVVVQQTALRQIALRVSVRALHDLAAEVLGRAGPRTWPGPERDAPAPALPALGATPAPARRRRRRRAPS